MAACGHGNGDGGVGPIIFRARERRGEGESDQGLDPRGPGRVLIREVELVVEQRARGGPKTASSSFWAATRRHAMSSAKEGGGALKWIWAGLREQLY